MVLLIARALPALVPLRTDIAQMDACSSNVESGTVRAQARRPRKGHRASRHRPSRATDGTLGIALAPATRRAMADFLLEGQRPEVSSHSGSTALGARWQLDIGG